MTVPPPPKPSNKKKIVLAIGVPVGAGCLLVLLAVAFGGIFWLTSKDVPVEDKDRAVLVGIGALSEWVPDFEPQAELGRYTKTRYFDGSYDVEYEYPAEGVGEEIYLYCLVTYERKASDARLSYTGVWSGSVLGMKLFGDDVTIEEDNAFFAHGDQSKFATLYTAGNPFGNAFVTRQDTIIFMLLVSGVYFDSPESFQELVKNSLDNLASYEP